MMLVLAVLILAVSLVEAAGAALTGLVRRPVRLTLVGGARGRSSDVDDALLEVDRDLGAIDRDGRPGGPREALRASWGRVLDLVKSGRAPGLRTCPHCGGTDVASARRCLFCSRPLAPARP